MITISNEKKKRMIQGYNALVKDSQDLSDMPFLHEDLDIDIEDLFIFQGLIASQCISALEKRMIQDEKKVRLLRGFSERAESSSTAKTC